MDLEEKYHEEFYRDVVPGLIGSGKIKYTEDIREGLHATGQGIYDVGMICAFHRSLLMRRLRMIGADGREHSQGGNQSCKGLKMAAKDLLMYHYLFNEAMDLLFAYTLSDYDFCVCRVDQHTIHMWLNPFRASIIRPSGFCQNHNSPARRVNLWA